MPVPFALLLQTVSGKLINLSSVDVVIIALYFAMVLGIGFYLKKYANTGEEFFLAGRDMTAWVAGLSFVAANLGSLELMGWAASAYQYGILATHWYWIGAIPAMLFLGIVMMPFYYISRTHSVPGYLQVALRESSRALAAISFGFMTVLMSGINMYSMALVMKVILGWDIHFSIWVSSLTVAAYVFLGGLLSAIFNEVLQFFLIWLGAIVVSVIGLIETGGWSGMVARIHANFPAQEYTHLWSTLGSFHTIPWASIGRVLCWGSGGLSRSAIGQRTFWWCSGFSPPKICAPRKWRPSSVLPSRCAFPSSSFCPGLLGLAVLPMKLVGESQAGPGVHTYNEVLPLMLARYCGPGLLGLGITALIAGFMSGMAGNVSAFSTVFTYDIYRAFLKKQATDKHYVSVGRWCTVLGVLVSIGTAYLVMQFLSIMDYVQALFSFFIAPLFGTVLLGMLWKRATGPGGFWGLLIGTASSIGMWAWVKLDPSALRYIALSPYAKDMAENMYRALWSWIICVVVTVVVSMATRPKSDAELRGLVYGATDIPSEAHLALYQRPIFWAVIVALVFAVLNIIFW